MKQLVLWALLGIVSSNVIAVPIHKWVDKDGKVHYSNVAPSTTQKSVVLRYTGVGNTGATTPKEEKTKSVAAQEIETEKRAQAESQESKQNCTRAKETVQTLESGVKVSRYNDKGEKEQLNEKTRKEELERAKSSVKEWCENK